MFDTLCLKSKVVSPSLFLAPMAGITNSAFRRLVSDFGGYGALFTEMLSGSAVLHENLEASPYTKRRESEGPVIYQLLLGGSEDISAVVGKLAVLSPFGLDLNLGCPAPEIRKTRGGVSLFKDMPRLKKVINALRVAWPGILTVKCRIGENPQSWRRPFEDRLRLFEDSGVDAVTVHPRFFREKLRRKARWEFFEWIASRTPLPLIASGDITSPEVVSSSARLSGNADGLMLGRIAVVKPWVFMEFQGESQHIDYGDVWGRFYRYVLEDFPPEKAIGRIKEFSSYYARNFLFGHELFRRVQSAGSPEESYDRAMDFFCGKPGICGTPSVSGI